MFYVLSKLLGWLLQPLALVMLALAVALVLLRRDRVTAARRLIGGCLLLLALTGLSPLGDAMILPLEERFARTELGPDASVDGIIVLGGGEDSRISQARHIVALHESGERMTEAIHLAHRFPRARIVFTGGSVEIVAHKSNGAKAADLFFRSQGLDMSRVTLENRARNTQENAAFTKALVNPKSGERWLLVTSAFHMPRSIGCFRQVGWDVAPWPVDYRTIGPADLKLPFHNPVDGLRRFELALREWVGLVAYRLSGRTNALLPR